MSVFHSRHLYSLCSAIPMMLNITNNTISIATIVALTGVDAAMEIRIPTPEDTTPYTAEQMNTLL